MTLGLERGGGSGSRAVQSQKETGPQGGNRWHLEVTVPPLRTPERCSLLLPCPEFWLAAWPPPWSHNGFPGLGSTLVFAPLWSTPRSLRCWHFTGLLHRLLSRPTPPALLCAIFFLLGGQGPAGLGARLAHCGSSGGAVAGMRELGWRPAVCARGCWELLGARVLGAEDPPGSTIT